MRARVARTVIIGACPLYSARIAGTPTQSSTCDTRSGNPGTPCWTPPTSPAKVGADFRASRSEDGKVSSFYLTPSAAPDSAASPRRSVIPTTPCWMDRRTTPPVRKSSSSEPSHAPTYGYGSTSFSRNASSARGRAFSSAESGAASPQTGQPQADPCDWTEPSRGQTCILGRSSGRPDTLSLLGKAWAAISFLNNAG